MDASVQVSPSVPVSHFFRCDSDIEMLDPMDREAFRITIFFRDCL